MLRSVFLLTIVLFTCLKALGQNNELHMTIDRKTNLHVRDVYELGDEGFLVVETTNRTIRLTAYGPDMKVKWQNLFNDRSVRFANESAIDVVYDSSTIFVCMRTDMFPIHVLALDHKGKTKVWNTHVKQKASFIAYGITDGALCCYTYDYPINNRTDIRYYCTVYDDSLEEIKTINLPTDKHMHYVGSDGVNTYFRVAYEYDETGAMPVDIYSFNPRSGLHTDFQMRIQLGKLHPAPSTEGKDIISLLNINYDDFTNTFFVSGLATDDPDKRSPKCKNFYIQQYNAKGKMLQSSTFAFIDIKKKLKYVYPEDRKFIGEIYRQRNGQLRFDGQTNALYVLFDFDNNLTFTGGTTTPNNPYGEMGMPSNILHGDGLFFHKSDAYKGGVTLGKAEISKIEQMEQEKKVKYTVLYADEKRVIFGSLHKTKFIFDAYAIDVKQ